MAVAAAEAAGLRSKLLATEVKSALCICPPQALWPSIQGVRERMDKSYLRWMPHINVAYPFVGAGRAEEAASVLRSAFRSAGIAEFSVALDSAGYFQHSKKSSTLWLAPRVVDGGEPVSASARRRSGNCCADVRLGIRHRSDALHVAMPQDVLDRLQRAVQGAIPACSHLRERGGDGQFRPHLSLAQLGAPRQATAALAELLRAGAGPEAAAALRPIADGVLPRRAPLSRGGASAGEAAAAAYPEADAAGAAGAGTVAVGAAGAGAVAVGAAAGRAVSSEALASSGLTFTVRCLYIIRREGFDDPFRVVGRVALGAGPADEECLPLGFVYAPPEPPPGSRCLRKGGNGAAILRARAKL